jgi:amino acid permease
VCLLFLDPIASNVDSKIFTLFPRNNDEGLLIFTTKSIVLKQQQQQKQTVLSVRGGGAAAAAASRRKPKTPPHKRAKFGKKGSTTITTTTKNTSTSSTRSSTPSISGTGTASMTSEIFNLVKNIVGVAVLSVPAAIATFGDEPSVLIPAIVLIVLIGVLSGYGFATIGKVCNMTGASSYGEAWKLSVNSSTSWIPAFSATFKTFLTSMAISMVLSDTFKILIFGTSTATSPGVYDFIRLKTLLTLTVGVIVPLCWMKNLSSLAPFSLLGVLGIAYTGLAMTIRYLDGSYSTVTAGAAASSAAASASKLLQSIPLTMRPVFGTNGWRAAFQPQTMLLLCTLSTAFMAHFKAPKYFLELYDNTIPRYNTVVGVSFLISILLMGYISCIGFLTFGKNSASVILNNYSSNDSYMSASRIAIAVSLLFTYPLAFQGCRDGILDIVKIPKSKRTNKTLNITTVALLTAITILAAILTDVGFVLAVGGGTFFIRSLFVSFFICFPTLLLCKQLACDMPLLIIS